MRRNIRKEILIRDKNLFLYQVKKEDNRSNKLKMKEKMLLTYKIYLRWREEILHLFYVSKGLQYWN